MIIMQRRFLSACLAALFAPVSAYSAAPMANPVGPVDSGTRLSKALEDRQWLPGLLPPDYNLNSLLLKSPGEETPQAIARGRALHRIWMQNRHNAGALKVVNLLAELPVTGRVITPSTDANYMEGQPAIDPVLKTGQTVEVPPASNAVVVLSDLCICKLPSNASWSARGYVQACVGQGNVLKRLAGVQFPADWVWQVSPGGQWQKLPLNSWNGQAGIGQPEPGAFLWVPSRGLNVSEEDNNAIADYLATLGDAGRYVSNSTPLNTGPIADDVQPLPNPEDDPWYVSNSDWGTVGLLQMPTARVRQAGAYSVSLNRTSPYSRYSFMLQPFDWMEAGFRYNNFTNKEYGVPSPNGPQGFKDKNLDAKFRLTKESAWLPETALGFRDAAGTGLFSGEYLVGSKRVGHVDFTLGYGWGSLGASGTVGNPFSFLSQSHFSTRKNSNVGSGGNFGVSSFFTGRGSIFGGVQVQLPWQGMVFKAELDGNDYQHEPFGNNLPQTSRLNYGLLYRINNSTDFSVGYERGNQLMVGVNLHGNLAKLGTSKISDPPMPSPMAKPLGNADWQAMESEIQQQTGWHTSKVESSNYELKLRFDNADAGYWSPAMERAIAVVHKYAPAQYAWFNLEFWNHGMRTGAEVVDRNLWLRQKTEYLTNAWREFPAVKQRFRDGSGNTTEFLNPPSKLNTDLGLGYQQIVGGPDGFLLYQLTAEGHASYDLMPNLRADGTLSAVLADNFANFKYTAPSNLPRVRTFQREYVTSSTVRIPNLQLTYFDQLGANLFTSAYGGLLEPMFAGVGGEMLYRPLNSPVAVGVDINSVKQRGFKQDFSLRNYQVNTGHLTGYWDTGLDDLLVKVSVGQYLAGDKGATFDLSRVFANQAKIGAYFTRTNVSAAQFGEGSFDKGIYVSLPFDAFFTKSTTGTARFDYHPLTRDGGAKLNRYVELYDVTKNRDPRLMQYQPAVR